MCDTSSFGLSYVVFTLHIDGGTWTKKRKYIKYFLSELKGT